MQNKKIFTLIILSVIAVVVMARGITARPRLRQGTESGEAGIYREGRAAGLNPSTVGTVKRRAKRSQFASMGRNPFVPKESGAFFSRMVLGGIVRSGKGFKAMIGDVVVGKGDKVGGSTIIEVRENGVILNDGTKDFELTMEQ